jgi:hypothetical protein
MLAFIDAGVGGNMTILNDIFFTFSQVFGSFFSLLFAIAFFLMFVGLFIFFMVRR